ncbi:hypothetical protein [Alicyclobacillus cellulosilyticus]|uniref:hypothetical protein n=1 Tax=Alicyclobacillus cellulosilyticus TaxID=1003997 RepID=UPI00166970EC|nr:hypothetical protein [Alicyclobacillus cellulosilyticus]
MRTWFADFWRAGLRLWRDNEPLLTALDMPLPAAKSRAWGYCLWAVLCWSAACAWTWVERTRAWPSGAGWYIVCVAAAWPAGYGWFRLYTLVAHVMTTNIFQVRGQRLRMLNVLTSVMALQPYLALAAFCIAVPAPWSFCLGTALAVATAGRSLWLVTDGYGRVFHCGRGRALVLFLGGTVLTAFVFAVGLLAMAVAAGVVAWLALAFLRGAQPRGQA